MKEAAEGRFYAPASSRLSQYGVIGQGASTLSVKGAQFTLEQLTKAAPGAREVFAGVFYLSPADYHSFHSSSAFSVQKAEYVHGDCWPVNDTFMPKIGGLLAKNERVVLSGTYEYDGKQYGMWYVPVAALNVGGIKLGSLDLARGSSV